MLQEKYLEKVRSQNKIIRIGNHPIISETNDAGIKQRCSSSNKHVELILNN